MENQWFDFFWTSPVTGVPEDMAFGQFSLAHLITLGVLAIGIAVLVITYCKSTDARRGVMRLAVGIAVLLMEVLRQASYILVGNYHPTILPLHLCAISTFCVFIDSVRPNSWTREFIYALGVWGAPCALIFPDWASQPLFNIYTWQAFLIHSCLLAYPLMLLVSKELRPQVRNLWKVVVIMVVFVAVSIAVNTGWDTNFWFLNTGSPGSPLEPIQVFSGQFYLPVLGLILAVLWVVMYLPWYRRRASVETHPSNAVS